MKNAKGNVATGVASAASSRASKFPMWVVQSVHFRRDDVDRGIDSNCGDAHDR